MTDNATPAGLGLSEGLGPCPFCGSHDVLLTKDAARWPVVQCQDCGANGPSVKLSPDEAVAQWNSRPGVAAERERIFAHIRSAMGHAEAGYDDVAWRLLASLVGPN